MSDRKRFRIHLFALLLGLVIIGIDLFTKSLIQNSIPRIDGQYPQYPYGGIGVFRDFHGVEFSIVHATNTGAAWGVLAAFPGYLFLLRIVLILGMVCFLFFFNKKIWWEIPIALIIAGAVGNMIDYFVYGHVIDMFRIILWGYDYPIFNVADCSIVVGIIWLFVLSWMP